MKRGEGGAAVLGSRRAKRSHRTSDLATTLTALAKVWSTHPTTRPEPEPLTTAALHLRLSPNRPANVVSLSRRRAREVARAS
jgi:hypothetical protein